MGYLHTLKQIELGGYETRYNTIKIVEEHMKMFHKMNIN